MAFIPLSDNPGVRRRFPFVNYALIVANIAVFVYELFLPDGGNCFTAAYALLPTAVLHGTSVTVAGCSIGEPVPVYLTLITATFLHANLLHIAGNMIYLYVFGDNVEDRLGHIGYLAFYLFCGVVANITQMAAIVLSHGNLSELNLGASGAIAGVLGAYLIFYPGSKVKTLIFIGIFFTFATLNAAIVIGFWFLLELVEAVLSLNVLRGTGGGVAYFAHVGGFVVGVLIALLVRPAAKHASGVARSYPAWPNHPDMRASGR